MNTRLMLSLPAFQDTVNECLNIPLKEQQDISQQII
jgi:hypothetical protein